MTTPIRDPDILDDIQARLKATNAFDGVYRSALPEDHGESASDRFSAVVAPSDWDELDTHDDASDELLLKRTVRWNLTLCVRMDDPQSRERALDSLLAKAQGALDNQSLAGVTIPGWTRLRKGKYATAEAPEQRMTVNGEAVYWIEGDSDPNYFDS